ncbi:type VI secretion system baseplate subunit TssF [Paraburkholderia phosphatilytica]|uniref:type VI secretion system baseplate subunit TssF n=1 Tax=Paraburkholderia phosphatilytica TaxID=2282883 RepID=UPI000E54E2E3|nr:type VI secretion system baseplate subunit TssF [Paraburkholderia phosphatilytica]
MDEPEDLLPHYERELANLRLSLREFERAYPKAAARLSISSGRSDDPQIERLLESAAFMNARAVERIEDPVPEFTEALIETVFPLFLQPFPACAIARFEIGRLFESSTQAVTIKRGTPLEHRPSLCQFSTAYDVTLAPLTVSRARFSPTTVAPTTGSTPLPQDATGVVSIEFASIGPLLEPGSELLPDTLRIFLDTGRTLAAALLDAILLHARGAYVEANGGREWKFIDGTLAKAVGFDANEILVDTRQGTRRTALRLLVEYLAFPQKFRFIDLDLAMMLRTAGPCQSLALHLPVVSRPEDVSATRQLEQLGTQHVQLFCTPVVNLYRCDAQPVEVKSGMHWYPVVPSLLKASETTIHSIDSVSYCEGEENAPKGIEIPPHRALRHWVSSPGAFWLRERSRRVAMEMAGSESAIRLVDIEERAYELPAGKLEIMLACTNGDVPRSISVGAPGGDLHSETLNLPGRITMLDIPSASVRLSDQGAAQWRLVSAFTPNHTNLSSVTALKDTLYLLGDTASPEATRYVRGIVGLRCRRITPTMHLPPIRTPVLVPGIEVTLSIDGAEFVGDALHTFAQLMEGYFMRYAGRGCLALVVRSDPGGDIYRGEPRIPPPTLSSL